MDTNPTDLEKLAVNDFEFQAAEAQFEKSVSQNRVFELYAKYIILGNKL